MSPTDKLRAFVKDEPCEPFDQHDAQWLLEHIASLEAAVKTMTPPRICTSASPLRIVRDDDPPPPRAA